MKKFLVLLICAISLTGCTTMDRLGDALVDFVVDEIVDAVGDNNENNNNDNNQDEDDQDDEDNKIEEEFTYKNHYCDFSSSNELGTNYWVRNGYKNNAEMFLSTWNRENYALTKDGENNVMALSLTDVKKKDTVIPYGAEIVSYSGYLYGYFGTRMKTFKREGTVQSFFTYNGPNQSHPEYEWDEIDIEFLGKDTTKVQFNYYDNGVGGHEYMYDLGFDSSLEYHDYGFVWRADKITWFVDFEPVYQVNVSLNQWGFFMMNVWGGNPANEETLNWVGRYQASEQKYSVYYDYVIASEFIN